MEKVIAICGKICCGKTYYSNALKTKENAVVLSCDEVTSFLFDNNLGDKHDEMTKKIKKYLLKKSLDIIKTKTSVVLDWGFWSKKDRAEIKEYFKKNNVICELHYIDIDNSSWKQNIEERNIRVLSGMGNGDYYLDKGLMEKLMCFWEEPSKEEIDVWHKLKR